MSKLGYVKPIVNKAEQMKTQFRGEKYIPWKAEIQCPACGYIWKGTNRTFYTCPKCKHKWDIRKWEKVESG